MADTKPSGGPSYTPTEPPSGGSGGSSGSVVHDGSLQGEGTDASPLGVSISPVQPTLRIRTNESGDSFLDVISSTVCGLGLPTFNSFDGTHVAFFGSNGTTQPTIEGSRTDGTALANLLTALAAMGLIVDGTGP